MRFDGRWVTVSFLRTTDEGELCRELAADSGKNVMDHLAVDISETEITPLETEDQGLMVNTQKVKNGGLKVVNVDRVFGHVIAELIGGTVDDPGLAPSSGHPH